MNELIDEKQKTDSYLTFKLGKESFAVNVNKIINILELVEITQIPKVPAYFAGVINLRGEVLPVIDSNIKLGMGKTKITGSTCILVVETQITGSTLKFGMLADAVLEVLEIKGEKILPPPEIGTKYKSSFITGVIQNEERFTMLVDINTFVNEEELTKLHITN